MLKENELLKKAAKYINAVLLFCIIIDPTSALFGLKDISFILFVIVSIPFIDYKLLYIPLTFIAVYCISMSVVLITDANINWSSAIGTLKSFVFLIYVLWVNNDFLKTFRSMYIMCLIMAVGVIIVWALSYISPAFYKILCDFSELKNDYFPAGKPGTRSFYGIIKVYSLYHRTSSTCVIPLVTALYLYFSLKKIKYGIQAVVFGVLLVISGTRANMLSCFLLVFSIFLFYLFFYKKRVVIAVLLGSIFVCVSLYTVYFLLTTVEHSANIKTGHLQSFIDLFESSPIRFFLLGFGPSAYMYSSGVGSITSLTELSYLELVKEYGLILTLVLMGMFCIPFIRIFKNKKSAVFEKFCLGMGYLSYLFIAGTNPLLINSTGFIVYIAMMYISNKTINEEFGIAVKENKNF